MCIISEMWQCVWTSEGNIQVSGVKYIKGVIYIIITIVYISFHVFYTAGLKVNL